MVFINTRQGLLSLPFKVYWHTLIVYYLSIICTTKLKDNIAILILLFFYFHFRSQSPNKTNQRASTRMLVVKMSEELEENVNFIGIKINLVNTKTKVVLLMLLFPLISTMIPDIKIIVIFNRKVKQCNILFRTMENLAELIFFSYNTVCRLLSQIFWNINCVSIFFTRLWFMRTDLNFS